MRPRKRRRLRAQPLLSPLHTLTVALSPRYSCSLRALAGDSTTTREWPTAAAPPGGVTRGARDAATVARRRIEERGEGMVPGRAPARI